MIFRRLSSDDLDKVLAIIGMGVSLLLSLVLSLVTGSILHGTLTFYIFLACAAYLILRPRLIDDFLSPVDREALRIRPYLVVNILFIVVFTLCVLCVPLRSEPYSRPVSFFVLVGLLGGLLAFESMLPFPRKGYEKLILAKIIMLGVLVRWFPQAIFPGGIWFDPWYHEYVVRETLATAYIPELGGLGYSKLPVMHLQMASSMLLTGLDFESTFMYLLSLLQVITQAIFTFMLVRRMFSEKSVALVAALLVSVADLVLAKGIIAYPNMLAAMSMIVLVYTIYTARQISSGRVLLLALFLMGTLILTHTVGSLAMAVLLFSLWLGFEIHRRVIDPGVRKSHVNIYTVALFSVAMLFWWMYASGHFLLLVKTVRWAFQIDRFQLPAPEQAAAYASKIPVVEVLLDRLGFSVFYALAAIGCLYLFSKRSQAKGFGFGLALGGVVLTSIGFLGSAFQVYIHPTRWYFMSQLTLAPSAAVGIMALSRIAGRMRPLWVAVLIGLLAFSMVSNTVANFDTPVLPSSRLVRHAFIESELASLDGISSNWKGTLASDQHTNAYLTFQRNRETVDINDSLDREDMLPLAETLVVVREYITTDTFYVRGSIWRLDFDLHELLSSQGFSRVFDAGSVSGFSREVEE